MSIFGAIKHAIFGDRGPLGGQFSGRNEEPAAPAAPAPVGRPAPSPHPASPQAAPRPASPAAPAATSAAPVAPAPAAVPAQAVDVEAVLGARAGAERLDWRHSIVDLLKLLELDSSLAARKELAGELNVHAGAEGTAEQNIALHKAVMRALRDNGGTVPAGLAD